MTARWAALIEKPLSVFQIADFGLSNLYQDDKFLQTYCGSPLYASPEIVNGRPYRGPEVDSWSLGVLLYTLVHGAMPFDGQDHKKLVQQISTGNYRKPTKPTGEALKLNRRPPLCTVCPVFKPRDETGLLCLSKLQTWLFSTMPCSSFIDGAYLFLADNVLNYVPSICWPLHGSLINLSSGCWVDSGSNFIAGGCLVALMLDVLMFMMRSNFWVFHASFLAMPLHYRELHRVTWTKQSFPALFLETHQQNTFGMSPLSISLY